MGYLLFWILIALVAATFVLVAASSATKRTGLPKDPVSTWTGLWRNLTGALSPATLSVQISAVQMLVKAGIIKDSSRLDLLHERRSEVLQERRVSKLVAGMFKLERDTADSNISLDDFLVATQVDEPAYIDVVSQERVNDLYERYAARK